MLLLSKLTGQEVWATDGRILGRLADVTARLDPHEELTLVDRILVHRKRERDVLVPWAAVESFTQNAVSVKLDGTDYSIASIDGALDASEILLVRDVLDTQIVDIAGQRLARVADVVLARRHDGRIEVVGIEAGFGAVLRRLGLVRLANG